MPMSGTSRISTRHVRPVVVSDSGCGRDETPSPHIEPFFTTKELGRDGLGLSTVTDRQAERCIHCRLQRAGHGTTFNIYLRT